MRVISGQYRGRVLESAKNIRPTEDKVRKALFDTIRGAIGSSRFLDLYAGSGAVGIEALSEGAGQVYFVENDPASCQIIENNLNKLKVGPNLYEILKIEVERVIVYLCQKQEKFDFVFLDPPYYKGASPRPSSASTGSAFALSERRESKGSRSAFPKESESLAPRLRPPESSGFRSGSTISENSESLVPRLSSGSASPKESDSLAKKALQTLGAYDILNRTGWVIIQHHRRDKLLQEVEQLRLWRTKSYSTTQLSFYNKTAVT